MNFYLFIIIIVCISVIYYMYENKRKYDLKSKEIELENNKIDLEKIRIENGLLEQSQEKEHS